MCMNRNAYGKQHVRLDLQYRAVSVVNKRNVTRKS